MIDYKNIRVCIDAGHGSNTAGKRTVPFTKDVDINGDGKIDVNKGESYREHYANVMVSNFLVELLLKDKFKILKTGWDDTNAKNDVDTEIEDRQATIRKEKCDYVLSIHFNASCSDMKKFDNGAGVSVYVRTEKEKRGDSDKLAKFILGELVKGTPQRNRGIGDGKFGMCNAVGMNVRAGLIIELAFMTNEHEAQDLMANEKFCKEAATEIYNGFIKYLNDGKKDIPTIKPTPSKPTTPLPSPIKKFDKVDWTKRLQIALNVYNIKTVGFKKLVIDAIAGDKTINACPEIKLNSKGAIVKLLQERLISLGYKCKVDGIFGRGTENTVKQFQKKCGLVNDAIVGKNSWSKLLGM